jgi:hypothetical protein
MATLFKFKNPSETSSCRVSTGAFADDGEFIPDEVTTVRPGETATLLIGIGRGLFFEEVSNDD